MCWIPKPLTGCVRVDGVVPHEHDEIHGIDVLRVLTPKGSSCTGVRTMKKAFQSLTGPDDVVMDYLDSEVASVFAASSLRHTARYIRVDVKSTHLRFILAQRASHHLGREIGDLF